MSLVVVTALMAVTTAWADTATWPELRPSLTIASTIGSTEPALLPETGPVIVTFFASWCPPCTIEFNHLNALVAHEGLEPARIVGINLHEDFGGRMDPARMAAFLDRTRPVFPLIEGSNEISAAFGGIERIPTVVVYGASGREVWRFIHERGATKTNATEEELAHALELARSG